MAPSRAARALGGGRVVEVELEERFALLDGVADRGPPHHAGGGGHVVLLAGPAGAEAPRGDTDGHGVEAG